MSIVPHQGAIKGSIRNKDKRKKDKWLPPSIGEFKTNFNGASHGNIGKSGVGVVILNFDAQIIKLA